MTLEILDQLDFLSSFLPYLRRYKGSIFVIKYGGSTMKDIVNMTSVLNNIRLLHYLGIKIIVVHGGGPAINDWLGRLNIVPRFYNGLRITDYDTMEIVQMVLAGQVNTKIVSLLNIENSGIAVGLSGIDCSTISARSLFDREDDYVGEVQSVNTNFFNLLLNNNYLPVISSLGVDQDGCIYNINADTVAGAIASSLKAEKLFLLTDTDGIMRNIDDASSLVTNLNSDDIIRFKAEGIISGGMIPKVDSCVMALQKGVSSAHIVNGKINNILLYEIFTNEGMGSCIKL